MREQLFQKLDNLVGHIPRITVERTERPPAVNGFVERYIHNLSDVAYSVLYEGQRDLFKLTPEHIQVLDTEVNPLEWLTSIIFTHKARELIRELPKVKQPYIRSHDDHQISEALLAALRTSQWYDRRKLSIEPTLQLRVTPHRVLFSTGNDIRDEFPALKNMSFAEIDFFLRANPKAHTRA